MSNHFRAQDEYEKEFVGIVNDLSYTRLLKACRENDIPIPPPGYYTKLSIGKPVDRAPLPDSKIEMIVIEAPVPKKQTDSQTEQKQPPALIPESTEHL